MAKTTTDYTSMFKDMMAAFPMDASSMQDAFKSSASYGEKLSKVALDAAGQSTEISMKWTNGTLSKLSEMSKVRDEPSDYAKAMTDFAAAQAELAAENMAAFAEVAKKVQMETVELMLSAGKSATADATAKMKQATSDAAAATKKTATAAR